MKCERELNCRNMYLSKRDIVVATSCHFNKLAILSCQTADNNPARVRVVSRVTSTCISNTMNTLVDRFAGSSMSNALKMKSTLSVDDEDFPDAAWGSEAGYGSVAKGVPSFMVPSVPDVSFDLQPGNILYKIYLESACSILAFAHRRSRRPLLQN